MANLQRPSFLPLKSNLQSCWPSEFYPSKNKLSKFVNSPSADSGISSFVSNSAVITPRTPISPSEFNYANNIKSPVYQLPLQNYNGFKSINNSPPIQKPTFGKPSANSTPIKSATNLVPLKIIVSPPSIEKDLNQLEEFYEYDLKNEDDADDEDEGSDDDQKDYYYDLEFLLQFRDKEFKICNDLQDKIKKFEIERKKHLEIKDAKKSIKSKEDELDLNNNCQAKDLNGKDKPDAKNDLLNSLNAYCNLDNCCCSTVDHSFKCPSLFVNLMALADAIFTSQCLFLASTPEAGMIDDSMSNFEVPILQDTKYCKFCKNNREARSFYLQHQTRDKNGRVVCPILRAHKCELCGKTGDFAHTRSYCPWSKHIRARVADTNKSFLFYNVRSMVHHETDDFNEIQINNDLTDTSEDE